MARTNLDEIVSYPDIIAKELSKNQQFVSLLTNIPNADLNDKETEKKWENSIFNYNYVEGVIQEANSFCCIDTEIVAQSNTIKDIYITILIGVHHNNMSLKNTDFKLQGNRRDNLIRELDYSLRNNRDCGIGGLELADRIKPVNIMGKDFSCKLVTYHVPDFAKSNYIQR